MDNWKRTHCGIELRWLLALLLLCVAPAWCEPITDETVATNLFADARNQLAALGLTIPRDILLKFRTRDELNTENAGHGGRAIELNGFYRAYNPESVWIVSGLDRTETLGVMAHELTHAWQSTESPQQDRKLTEGFAQWAEYHVLRNIGHVDEAEKLTTWPDPDYGGGLRWLLDLEKREGIPAVIQYARTQREIP